MDRKYKIGIGAAAGVFAVSLLIAAIGFPSENSVDTEERNEMEINPENTAMESDGGYEDQREEMSELCMEFAEAFCVRDYTDSDGREGYELLTEKYRSQLEGTGDPETTREFYRENEIVQDLLEVEDIKLSQLTDVDGESVVTCRCIYKNTAQGYSDINGWGEGDEFIVVMYLGLEKEDGQWKISGCTPIQW